MSGCLLFKKSWSFCINRAKAVGECGHPCLTPRFDKNHSTITVCAVPYQRLSGDLRCRHTMLSQCCCNVRLGKDVQMGITSECKWHVMDWLHREVQVSIMLFPLVQWYASLHVACGSLCTEQ